MGELNFGVNEPELSRQELRAKQAAEKEKQEKQEREKKEKEKAAKAKEKEKAAKEKEKAAMLKEKQKLQEKERLADEKEKAAKEKERAAKEKEKAAAKLSKDALATLAKAKEAADAAAEKQPEVQVPVRRLVAPTARPSSQAHPQLTYSSLTTILVPQVTPKNNTASDSIAAIADLRSVFTAYAEAAKESMPKSSPSTSVQSQESMLKEEHYEKLIEVKDVMILDLQVRNPAAAATAREPQP